MKQTLKQKIARYGDTAKKTLFVAAVVAGILCFIYFTYWAGKSVSYNLFYENMVIETTRETVREMVKEGSLK